MRPTDSALSSASSKILAAAVECSFRRFQFVLKANFNPNQPRIPAGNREGGRWTDSGYESTGRSSSPSIVHLASDTIRPYQVDLAKEEGQFGAHTLRRHVSRKIDEMLVEMGPTARWWEVGLVVVKRNGSFPSIQDANYYVNDILKDNTDTINAYLSSTAIRPILLTKRYGYKTGIEWYRFNEYSYPRLRDTYGVGVVIKKAPSHRFGFVVLTSYPRNEDEDGFKMMRKIPLEPTFILFTKQLHGYDELYKTTQDIAETGLQGITSDKIPQFVSFIDHILSSDFNEDELGDLWARSPADVIVRSQHIREVFEVAKRIALLNKKI